MYLSKQLKEFRAEAGREKNKRRANLLLFFPETFLCFFNLNNRRSAAVFRMDD